MTDDAGLYFSLGPGGNSVLAPVAPGIVRAVPIQEWRILPLGSV